jgi:tellurite resistance protein TerA
MLAPGANAPLPNGPLTLVVRHAGIAGSDIDVSAFLVAANGKVRSDEDMCFYGQPSVANGAAVQEHSDATSARFRLDTSKLPADVDKVVLTATIHENTAVFGRMDAIDLDMGGVAGRIPCAGMAETALLLAEIYRRGTDWKVRVVGQGFKGGLAALATHLGVDIGTPAPTTAPATQTAPTPSTPTIKPSLSKVVLTKKGEKARVDLRKQNSGPITVTAVWTDNGDGRDNNDDLDLRAGILMPDGCVHWLAASHPGALDAHPYARHQGDVRGASQAAPGTETIAINPAIASLVGGPVAMVFSVYSAVSNGAVSIASLKPVMRVQHGDQVVECSYSFPDGKDAQGVYTYVIGTIACTAEGVDVQLSGATSPPNSESTPWIAMGPTGPTITFDGPPVFKAGRTFLARLMGSGPHRYANL